MIVFAVTLIISYKMLVICTSFSQLLTCPTMKLVILSLCLAMACVSTKHCLSKQIPPIHRPCQPMRITKSGAQPEQKICQSTNWKLQAKVLLQRLKNQSQIAVHWNSRRVQRALLTSVVLRTPARTALLEDTRLLRMNGLGRYVFVHVLSSTIGLSRLLSLLTMPGSVEAPSSLMNT